MNEFRFWEKDFFGRKLRIEHGKVAKQAHGSCVIRYADSMILATVDGNEDPISGDFMPLTVEYQEKFYAAGKIPGGFIKREGRPGENAILSARLIDRPIRPLFPDGLRNEVQVIVTVLSADPDNPPDLWGIFGASLSLNISEIPFEGIAAGVRVGYVDGEYVINPNQEELEKAELDIVVAGTKDAVTMVEGEALEVSEEIMVGALKVAHEAIKELCEFQEEIIKSFGEISKWQIEMPKATDGILEAFDALINDQEVYEKMQTPGKHAKDKALKVYRDEKLEEFAEKNSEEWPEEVIAENMSFLKNFYHDKVKHVMRRAVIEKDIRMDGRNHTEIRPITCELDFLPRAHGSALFTRGETQSLGIVTLGAPEDEQIVDSMFEDKSKTFMLHYNFPPFCTGEAKRLRGVGRREIGHGHLAERSLKNLVPKSEEFPYTIRVVSEVLESNGSSSMATVCSGSLSLMAAGVPMPKHVAGVAMGMIQEPDKTVVLTDILGNEDHLGDMDFKVTGSKDGITAFQMDVKVSGVSEEVMLQALYQAKEARLKIIDIMTDAISEPRDSVSLYAPVIKTMPVPYEKIGEIIGPGGKVIKKLSSEYESNIFIDDAKSQVKVMSANHEKVDKLLKVIENMVTDVQVGKAYDGSVTRVENYGVFVELAPGKTGLVHSSKVGMNYKEFLKDIDVGSALKVEVTGVDNMGRIQLKKFGVEVTETERRSSDRKPNYQRRPRGDRNDNRGRSH